MAETTSSAFSITIMDYSREKSVSRFNIQEITAANFAAHITARDAFIQAVEDIIDGIIQGVSSSLNKNFAGTAPGNEESSREKKVLVSMYDGTVNKPFNFTIPTRKVFNAGSWKPLSHSDEIDPTCADAAALITACNNFVRSPYGNAATVIKLTQVGRNL